MNVEEKVMCHSFGQIAYMAFLANNVSKAAERYINLSLAERTDPSISPDEINYARSSLFLALSLFDKAREMSFPNEGEERRGN